MSKIYNNEAFPIKGSVVIRDLQTKEVILNKDNLVLFRSRLFLFENLFKQEPPSSLGLVNNRDRKICLFKVGSGGADINGNPFNPYVPKFSDTDLANPVPFVIEDTMKDSDPAKKNNPSVYTEIPAEKKHLYHLKGSQEVDGSYSYYGKIFEDNTEEFGWSIDSETGKIQYKIHMIIQPDECRGFLINELGLVIANETTSGDVTTYTQPELATRITFDTESLTSLTKGLDIEYILNI